MRLFEFTPNVHWGGTSTDLSYGGVAETFSYVVDKSFSDKIYPLDIVTRWLTLFF